MLLDSGIESTNSLVESPIDAAEDDAAVGDLGQPAELVERRDARDGPPGISSGAGAAGLVGVVAVLMGPSFPIPGRSAFTSHQSLATCHCQSLSVKSCRIVSDLIRWFVGSTTRIWIWMPRSGAGYGGGYDG